MPTEVPPPSEQTAPVLYYQDRRDRSRVVAAFQFVPGGLRPPWGYGPRFKESGPDLRWSRSGLPLCTALANRGDFFVLILAEPGSLWRVAVMPEWDFRIAFRPLPRGYGAFCYAAEYPEGYRLGQNRTVESMFTWGPGQLSPWATGRDDPGRPDSTTVPEF